MLFPFKTGIPLAFSFEFVRMLFSWVHKATLISCWVTLFPVLLANEFILWLVRTLHLNKHNAYNLKEGVWSWPTGHVQKETADNGSSGKTERSYFLTEIGFEYSRQMDDQFGLNKSRLSSYSTYVMYAVNHKTGNDLISLFRLGTQII